MPNIKPNLEVNSPIIRVVNKDGTQISPGLRGAYESNPSGFSIATGTTDYDVRSNQSNHYFTSTLRNVWYPEANAYYRTAYWGQIAFDQDITIKFKYISGGSEVTGAGIPLKAEQSPYTFPANALVTNILITNNSGSTVNISPLILQ